MQSHYFDINRDYNEVCQWWEAWGWPILPPAFLPKTGIIISNQGVNLCAAWLYRTDSAACWAENYIANKAAPRDLRQGSMEFLIEELVNEGKKEGFLLMLSSIKHKGLIKKLKANGFAEDDKEMSNLTKVL